MDPGTTRSPSVRRDDSATTTPSQSSPGTRAPVAPPSLPPVRPTATFPSAATSSDTGTSVPPTRNGTRNDPHTASRNVSSSTRAYALVLLLAVLLAVWGSFLVPFRVSGTLVPVSWAIAVIGNLALGRAGAHLLGSTGALLPGLLWLAVTLTLAGRRPEGDVVVPGTAVGMGFLLLGAVASAVAYGSAALRPRS